MNHNVSHHLLVLLSLLVVTTSEAQTRLDPVGFPLAIGNKWYYSYTGRGVSTPVLRVKTIVDTLAGMSAFLVRESAPGLDSIRTEIWIVREGSFYDSLYQGHVLLYDASLSKDTSWWTQLDRAVTVSYHLDTVAFFGAFFKCQARSYSNYAMTSAQWQEDSVAEGVGWYYHYYHWYGGDYWGTDNYQLIGLLKSGVLFGDTLLTTSVDVNTIGNPGTFALYQNYPNPFNPTTTIRYALPRRSFVTLAVFNTLGQQVAMLVNGEVEAGYHEARFDARGLASGVYFYRLTAGGYSQIRKLCIVK
jgi:hypothetical protein